MIFSINTPWDDNPVESFQELFNSDVFCFFPFASKPYTQLSCLTSQDILSSLKNGKSVYILSQRIAETNFKKSRVVINENFIFLDPAAKFFFKEKNESWADFTSFKNWIRIQL